MKRVVWCPAAAFPAPRRLLKDCSGRFGHFVSKLWQQTIPGAPTGRQPLQDIPEATSVEGVAGVPRAAARRVTSQGSGEARLGVAVHGATCGEGQLGGAGVTKQSDKPQLVITWLVLPLPIVEVRLNNTIKID
ncbi:hypothetical protein E2C01_018987 [Portunus trituberculatus]|uniref:Uncharacterized protein n=1 Tax=Portunus trituberculatus TaxID=210409 RepID=A0A5B7DYL4_PORTR|nr:hypothetical protein [Portunus trituberculatus]